MHGFGLTIEELEPGVVMIALRGELDLAHAYTFDEELRRIEESRPSCVVINLKELAFLDSCGLARLLGLEPRGHVQITAEHQARLACVAAGRDHGAAHGRGLPPGTRVQTTVL